MKTRILSVDAGYSLGNLFREIPTLQAQLSLLNLDFQGEVKADSKTQFIALMQEAVKDCNVLLIIDGSQDLYTREVLAQGFQKPLRQNEKAAKNITDRFARANRKPNALGMAYAQIPEGAIPLLNPDTVEQGFLMVFPSLCIAVLPASRRALEPLFADQFFPLLLKSIHREGYTVAVPLREDRVAEVEDYAARIRRRAKDFLPVVCTGQDGTTLRLTAIRSSEKESRQCCDSFLEDLVSELGNVTTIARIGVKGTRAVPVDSPQKHGFYDLPAEEADTPLAVIPSGSTDLTTNELEEDEELSITPRKNTKSARNNKKRPRKERNRMGAGKKILLTLLVCIFTGSLGYLVWYQVESMKNRSNYETLREVYDNPGILAPAGYPAGYDKEFSALWSINPDTVGWISIPDTGLDYPVVQADDNEKYFRTNFEGTYSEHAVPFVDASVNLKTPSANMLIYGHNIRTDGQMFNILKGYKELEFLQQHPVVDFNTIYHRGKYKIFSIFYSNTRPEHGPIFPYHEFIDSGDSGGQQSYIDAVTVRSIFDTGVDVNASDELLTLSTCSYEFKDARYVVVARRLRSGEDESVDSSQIKKNPTPLYPDVWYKLFGGTPPATASLTPFAFLAQQPIRPEDAPTAQDEAQSTLSADTLPMPTAMGLTKAVFPLSSPIIPNLIAQEGLPVPQDMATKVIKKPAAPSATTTSKKKIIKGKAAASTPPPAPAPAPVPAQEDALTPPVPSHGNFSDDASKSMSIKLNGKVHSGSPITIIPGMVEAEMGASFQPEALKAQAVAAYTYVRFQNERGISPSVVSKKPISAVVQAAVAEVLGESISYQGKYINSTYCASNAGQTNDSQSVWGGFLPYLISVESPGDTTLRAHGATETFSEESMASLIRNYCKLDPYSYSDPENWFSEPTLINGRYVDTISVCGEWLSGREVREELLEFQINSAAFEVAYAGGSFTFTTYGYGHGVGMSQQGADYYAMEGWTYQEILAHYYANTDLS